jgi:hypothetical protein
VLGPSGKADAAVRHSGRHNLAAWSEIRALCRARSQQPFFESEGGASREFARTTPVTYARKFHGYRRMRTAVVRLKDADLSTQMVAMREWLDCHGCEPARFVYDQTGDALVVSVDFSDPAEGEAFATRFDGGQPTQIASSLVESRPAEVDVRSA